MHVLVLTIEWSYYVHGTDTIIVKVKFVLNGTRWMNWHHINCTGVIEKILLSRWDVENTHGCLYLTVKRNCFNEVLPLILHMKTEHLPIMANYIIYVIFGSLSFHWRITNLLLRGDKCDTLMLLILHYAVVLPTSQDINLVQNKRKSQILLSAGW